MDLINVVLILVVVGFVLWLAFKYIPMPEPIKTVITVFVVIVLILWLLQLFGIGHIPIGARR